LAIWDGRRDELVHSYKEDTVEFYKKINQVDIICFKEAPILPPKDYKPDPPKKISEDTWEDKHGRIYRVSEVSNEIFKVKDPVLEEQKFTKESFKCDIGDVTPDPSIFEACDYVLEKLGQDRYIAGSSGGLGVMPRPGGTLRGLMMYIEEPEVIKAAVKMCITKAIAKDKYYIRLGQDGVLLEEDMAGSNGPLISPSMFREFSFEAMKERIANLKKMGQQVILHNCGNNIPLMEMFIEAGVDCYQSLQTTAGMDVGFLKERFGGRLCFWGGIATELLIEGTMDEVRKNVREAMEKGGPGGGFILGPSHSIAKGTKYDNFMAMLDEYDKYKDKYH
jgi:uroporphyrinogen-III decarboxylase